MFRWLIVRPFLIPRILTFSKPSTIYLLEDSDYDSKFHGKNVPMETTSIAYTKHMYRNWTWFLESANESQTFFSNIFHERYVHICSWRMETTINSQHNKEDNKYLHFDHSIFSYFFKHNLHVNKVSIKLLLKLRHKDDHIKVFFCKRFLPTLYTLYQSKCLKIFIDLSLVLCLSQHSHGNNGTFFYKM